MRVKQRGGRGPWFVVGITALIGAALYPIVIMPYLTQGKSYAGKQAELLKDQGLTKEQIQPEGLPVWSDPFKPKDK
eukprot:m.29102 g.29102  ORF g.29102 m.29102 type:complete len:76 (-) comp9118_c0_seq1:266-493(-)